MVEQFDKKWQHAGKRALMNQEKNLKRTQRGLKEDPINEKPNDNPITVKPTEKSINKHLQEAQDPEWLMQWKTLF